MEWNKLVIIALFAFYLGSVPFATFYCYKAQKYCKKYIESMDAIVKEIVKTNEDFIDKNTVFKATGYSTLITDEGKVLVTFKKDIGDENMAYTREVELPAWMWNNVIVEASYKLTLEALEKAKNEDHKRN